MEISLKYPCEIANMTQIQMQRGGYSSCSRDSGPSYSYINRLYLFHDMQYSASQRSGSVYSSSTGIQRREIKLHTNEIFGIQKDVRILCNEGKLKEALHLLELMEHQELQACSATYAMLLQACIKQRALQEGKLVHAQIKRTGFRINVFLGSKLVHLYAKCGSLVDARKVFDEMPVRNVFTWTIMITGYVKHNRAKEALELFRQMEGGDVKPNAVTFLSILQACNRPSDLEQGRQIHSQIIKNGFEVNESIGNALINMFSKCGSLEDARQVFNKMPVRSVVSWTTMIAGYTQHGQAEEALRLFSQMEKEDVKPNKFTFAAAFKACAIQGDLERGKQLHACMNIYRVESDVYVEGALVDMYLKCRSLKLAQEVFKKICNRDVVIWTSMIAGNAYYGHHDDAIELFQQMQQDGVKPNEFTFAAVLKAHGNLRNLKEGIQVHLQIIESGFELDVVLGGALIDMYAKCRSIELACQVFDSLPKNNPVPWNAMIAGYVYCGFCDKALKLFWQMTSQGVEPDEATFVGIIKACASLRDLEQGKQICAQIIKMGLKLDNHVGISLINMYVKCGNIKYAREIFQKIRKRNSSSWSVMITGYAQHGHANEALDLFHQMLEEGIQANEITFVGVLHACAILGDLEQGMQLHALLIEKGFESNVFIVSALIHMYAKCKNLKQARKVFDSMLKHNVVSWTSMIAGYTQNGYYQEALELFHLMQEQGIKPNEFTLVSVLNACTSLAYVEKGKQVHNLVNAYGFESDVFIVSSLVNMYGKLGNVEEARKLFDKVSKPDVVLWTAMIAGYAKVKCSEEAFRLFWRMEPEGVKPNEFTFVSILQVCADLMILEEGKKIHAYIIECGFESDVSIRCSIIIMYAKCKCIELARRVFDQLPKEDVSLWNAMIAGYSHNGLCGEALQNFKEMQQEGVTPNHNTFVSVLSACSNAGLVDEGLQHFKSMSKEHHIIPTGQHYACLINLLVRAGRLKEASSFIKQQTMLR